MRDLKQKNVRLIRVQPETPLLLGDRSGIGNYQETTDFIPGSAIRGAVASHLLQQCTRPERKEDHAGCPDREDCPFWQLFGQDEPLFGNAYPGSFGPAWPFPLTARTCKRYPGWPTSKAEQRKQHGVFDVLFAEFAYELVADPAYPSRELLQPALGQSWSKAWLPDRRRQQDRCPHGEGDDRCGQPTKPATGYYTWARNAPQPAQKPPVSRATHVGINRARGVAEDELLFTQETIQAAKTKVDFFATVRGPADSERLRVLDNALTQQPHYVGRGRSRGNGRVVIGVEHNITYPDLSERLHTFQENVADALAPYVALDDRISVSLPGRLFSLTLRAPAILAQAGVPMRVPTVDSLDLPDDVVCLRAWARTEQVGGWDSAAGMPRRTRLAARAGSVYLFFAPESVDKETQLQGLQRIEEEGIGDEREKGYGEVTVCAPFHVQKSLL